MGIHYLGKRDSQRLITTISLKAKMSLVALNRVMQGIKLCWSEIDQSVESKRNIHQADNKYGNGLEEAARTFISSIKNNQVKEEMKKVKEHKDDTAYMFVVG